MKGSVKHDPQMKPRDFPQELSTIRTKIDYVTAKLKTMPQQECMVSLKRQINLGR